MTIPTYIEKLILSGIAEYRTQSVLASRSLLEVPKGGFVILFGMDARPVNHQSYRNAVWDISISSADTTIHVQDGTPGINTGSEPIQQREWPIYMVTDKPIVFHNIGTTVNFSTLGTAKVTQDNLSRIAPFTYENAARQDYPVRPQSYLAAFEFNPTGAGSVFIYYPFGNEFSENVFGTAFTGIGFNSFVLPLIPFTEDSFFEVYDNDDPLAALPGYNLHYVIVNKRMPANKDLSEWI